MRGDGSAATSRFADFQANIERVEGGEAAVARPRWVRVDSVFHNLIISAHDLPPEAMWVLMLAVAFGATLLMLRLFGQAGLIMVVVVGLIGANIQVLKIVQFGVLPDPVALGTVLFATTYLSTDILNEYYGKEAAHRAVWLGFAALVLHLFYMMLTLSFRPIDPASVGADYGWAVGMQGAIEQVFLPQPALLLAGLTAYLLSQHHDVWAFHRLREVSDGRMLWLRNNASTALSALIDNTVFSVLAWVVLASEPLGWRPLIFTYILGTYVLRLLVALFDTPVMYAARFCLPSADRRPVAAESA